MLLMCLYNKPLKHKHTTLMYPQARTSEHTNMTLMLFKFTVHYEFENKTYM
jgi:hypothetical protein